MLTDRGDRDCRLQGRLIDIDDFRFVEFPQNLSQG